AFVDVVSGGRLRLGIGLGYRAEEFEGFGVPRAQRLGRTLETIEILKLAWTGERFSFDGKYFKLREVRVLPRPVSQPHPELLWGAGAAKSIRRAAELDLSFACVGGRREIGIYLEALKAAGKDPARFSIVNSRVVYIADSEEQAWRDTRDALMYQAELYGKWLAAAAGTRSRQGAALAGSIRRRGAAAFQVAGFGAAHGACKPASDRYMPHARDQLLKKARVVW